VPLRSYRGLSSFSIICQPLRMPFASCSSIKTSCLRSAKRLRQPPDLIYCSYSTYDVPPIAGPAGCATLVKPKRDSLHCPLRAPIFRLIAPHKALRCPFVFASKEAEQMGCITLSTHSLSFWYEPCPFLESSFLLSYCVISTLHSYCAVFAFAAVPRSLLHLFILRSSCI